LIVRSTQVDEAQRRLADAGVSGYVLTSPARADNPVEVFELPRLEIIGTMPLPGLGTALSDILANVQVFGNRDFTRQWQLHLTGFLDRNANSVGVGSGRVQADAGTVSAVGAARTLWIGVRCTFGKQPAAIER
jgi:hypothetical protein